MRRIFTITLLSILFFACQNDTQQAETTSTNTEASASNTAATAASATPATSAAPKHHKASAMSPFIGKWFYRYAIKNTEYYKGRYIDLKGDGSFTSGIDDKQNNSGTWSLDETDTYLDIDYADNSKEKDEQYKAQLNHNVIILIGNAPKNTTGNQIKLERITD